MGTWHQSKRATKLYSETEWNVVDDPPNDLRTIMSFSTEEKARQYIANRKKHGTGNYLLLIPPRVQNPLPRKGSFPRGRTPPHLKRYLFKKGHR